MISTIALILTVFQAYVLFFFNDTATTEIYTLSLHDALPISCSAAAARGSSGSTSAARARRSRRRSTACARLSCATVQRASELIEVVVVVPGHHREDRVDRAPPARIGVNAGACPVVGPEPLEKLEGLFAPLGERGQRDGRVVREVLALLRPAIGVGRDEPRLLHRHDELHPLEKPLLVVAQVADHLRRGPALRGRAACENLIAGAPHCGRHLTRRPRDPRQPFLTRAVRVLVYRRHATPPAGSW